MNLVIPESDVILVDGVPLLNTDLVSPCSCLSSHQLLQITNCVIIVALHANLLPQSIVEHHLYHLRINPNSQFYNKIFRL
ncbi:ubiquitin protein [Trifolium repens]|nr:ubiquitin protein [Trifolium repens]